MAEVNKYNVEIDANFKNAVQAQDDLKKLAEEAKRLRQELKQGKISIDEFDKQMSKINHSANEARQSLSVLRRGTKESAEATGFAVAKYTALFNVAQQTAQAVFNFGKECIQAGIETTKLKNALVVMTGDMQTGTKAYEDFAKFAAETPFNTNEVVEYGKQMLAQGYALDEVTKYLRIFGDTASATGSDLGGITLVMGQIRNSSKLMTQDIMQLQNRGVNVWQMLADASGKSMEEMKEAVHKGTVSGAEAFEMLSGQMQKTFGGMMEKQASSLEGQLNELGETVDVLKAKFGEWLTETLHLAEAVGKITKGIKDLVGETEENRKADTALNNEQALVRQSIEDTKYVLEELEDDYYHGRITLKEYEEATEKINEGCSIAENGLNQVNMTVDSLNQMMRAGIITAGDYAQALANITTAQAKIGAIQRQMTDAIVSGDSGAVDNLKHELASVSAEIQYEMDNAKAIGQHYKMYGQDGRGTIKTPTSAGGTVGTTKGGKSGGSKESKPKQTQEEKDIEKLVEKYTKAKNIEENMLKLKEKDIEISKAKIDRLVGEGKYLDENKIKIDTQNLANERALAMYEQELKLAEKISDPKVRQTVIDQINAQKDKQVELNNELLKTIEFERQREEYRLAIAKGQEEAEQAYNMQEKQGAELELYQAELTYKQQLKQLEEDMSLTADEKKAKAYELLRVYQEQKKELEGQKTTQETLKNMAMNYTNQLASGIAQAIVEGKNFGDAMKQIFAQLLEQLIQMAIVGAIFGFGAVGIGNHFNFAKGGKVRGYANGGDIRGFAGAGLVASGRGTGTSDNVPAMLSKGEFVIPARSVDNFSDVQLQQMRMGMLPTDENGQADIGVSNTSIAISAIDAKSFKSFLKHGGADTLSQITKDRERNFNSAKGSW